MSQFGEPWELAERSQRYEASMNMTTNPPTPNMATDRWTEVLDAEGNVLAHDYPYNESPFSGDLLPRILACVNFCRQFPTEWLEMRQLLFLKEGDRVSDRSCADIPNFEGKAAVVLNAEIKNVVFNDE